ncbi:MAG: peptidylprolyl isomerase [Bacteroidetes bacterium]|jgi:peptidylprolyl isomerase|nr:peptidylprolyl isomerase [Bacteroidota bacterium]
MINRINVIPLALGTLLLCGSLVAPDKRAKVLITTDFGSIKVVLFDETPLHRDNFLKLVNNKTYDSTMFHRVIKEFMIQGGDPDSKKAQPGQMLGNGNVGYTINAEFHPNLFHKRGALAAARLGDQMNPTKASSGCQFYIVQGKVQTDSILDMTQQRMDMQIKQGLFNTIINQPENALLKQQFIAAQQRFQSTGNPDSLNFYSAVINPKIDEEFAKTPHRVFTAEQRNVYKTIGGTPFLDGGYTVFGEVVEGMEVVDKITEQQRDRNDRPLTDIRMTMKIVKK